MILIITYDLRTPKDYHDFYEAIKAQGEQGKWWHYMTATWLLSTSKTPQQVVDAIQIHLDKQDFLLVCELASNFQGRLPKPAWNWIEAEFRQTVFGFGVNELSGSGLSSGTSITGLRLSDLASLPPPPKPKK